VKHSAEVRICNKLGLHLRAAAAFARVAERFRSEITLSHGPVSANGKSIISLVTLAAGLGAELLIEAEGPDAAEAVAALEALVGQRFGEAS
jgi:phosphocarrier protein HPr